MTAAFAVALVIASLAGFALVLVVVARALSEVVTATVGALADMTDRILNPPRPEPVEPSNGETNDAMKMFDPPWESWEPPTVSDVPVDNLEEMGG